MIFRKIKTNTFLSRANILKVKTIKVLNVLFLIFHLYGFCSFAYGEDISIAMGNFEPYFIEHNESGIFTEIIDKVFSKMPHHRPKYSWGRSNNRLWVDFSEGKLDGVSNLFDSVKLKACRTDPIFRFRDIAISNKKDNLTINTIGDLEGKNIVTFQGAKAFFGKQFNSVIKTDRYREVAKPHWQAKALFTHQADVSVGDMFIFLDSIKTERSISLTPQGFSYHDIFPAIYSRMGFRDKKVCKEFNEALKIIKNSGEYEKVYHKYLKQLNYVF